MLVVMHHMEQIKSLFGMTNIWTTNGVIHEIGKLGVYLFFVLSGFLITYLLFEEKSIKKKINYRDFLIRRVLRIWPLYFLVLIFGLFILPKLITNEYIDTSIITNNILELLVLYSTFLANVVVPLYGAIPYISHLWSIGAEEQFYLFWPLLVMFSGKRVYVVILLILLTYLFADIYLLVEPSNTTLLEMPLKPIKYILNYTGMIVGAGFAYIAYYQKAILNKYILNGYFFFLTSAVLLSLILLNVKLPISHFGLYSILFGIVIANLALNPKIKNILEFNVLKYLGKVSYGIYMYHPICIMLIAYGFQKFGIEKPVLFYFLCVISTIGISTFSYEFFEKPFLKIKRRFSKI